MAMPALVLLPPLPPLEVARGQQCFGFLEVTFVVRMVVSRGKQRPPVTKSRRGGARRFDGRYQYVIPKLTAPPVRDRRLDKTRVRRSERLQMLADIVVLTADGSWNRRPARGNGISGDCPTGPCPFVSCRYNLFITVRPSGSVKLNFPGKDIDEVGETCALRKATEQAGEDEPMSFEEIGAAMGLTDSRTEQICAGAIRKMRAAGVRLRDEEE